MKYLAAYCLAVLGGNATPSADDLTTILQSVGITPEETQLNAVMTALEGKTLHDVRYTFTYSDHISYHPYSRLLTEVWIKYKAFLSVVPEAVAVLVVTPVAKKLKLRLNQNQKRKKKKSIWQVP